MKNILLAAFALFSLVAQDVGAQFKAGMISVGGSASGSNSKRSDYPDNWSLYLEPSIGYYYTDHTALGIAPTFNFYDSETRYFTIAPFWRYNKSLADKFGVYYRLSPFLGEYTSTAYTGNTIKIWSLGLAAGIGVFYFPVKRLSIEMNLGNVSTVFDRRYESDSLTSKNQWTDYSLQSTGLSLSLFYHLGGKAK